MRRAQARKPIKMFCGFDIQSQRPGERIEHL
jgi:hypothetical protein